MMTIDLSALQNGNRCRTWRHPSRLSGKVVVVFDDLYRTALTPNFLQPFGWGLYTIFREVVGWRDALAIAFVDLPDDDPHEDVAEVLEIAQKWWEGVNGVATDTVVLVDMNKGYDPKWPTGVDVLEVLRSPNAPEFAKRARLGVLSVAGVSEEVRRKKPWLQEFDKRTFDKSHQRFSLSPDLTTFLGGDDLDSRLWPPDPMHSDGTADPVAPLPGTIEWGKCSAWFDDDRHVIIKHDWKTVVELQKTTEAVAIIRGYLQSLLGFPPPESWLQIDQFQHLWQDLKHLVGAFALLHGERGAYTLTLGNLVLLFGAAVGSAASPSLSTIRWSSDVVRRDILPQQTRDCARSVVKSLAAQSGVFKNLFFHDDDGRCLIEAIGLTANSFTVQFALDVRQQTKRDTPALIDQLLVLGDYHGVVYSALRSFLLTSASSLHGREPRCCLNLTSAGQGPDASSLLEFRRCQ